MFNAIPSQVIVRTDTGFRLTTEYSNMWYCRVMDFVRKLSAIPLFYSFLFSMYVQGTYVGKSQSFSPPAWAFQFQNFWTDFNEIWYGSCTAGDHPEFYLLIPYNWPELARWERQFRHYWVCAVFAFQRVRRKSHFARVDME